MAAKSKLGLIMDYLKISKKWWLAAIMLYLLLVSFLIVATQGSVISPFIYAIF